MELEPQEDDFTNPARYASDYYYNYLATLPNGENLQAFYLLIDSAITLFHSSDTDAESVPVSTGDGLQNFFYVDKFNFADMGLTLEEAASVRFLYAYDHPLYYWIYNGYIYDSSNIYICVEEEYATGEARAYYNTLIYEGIAAMVGGLSTETSPYHIALAYYERLLSKADYAFEEDGTTPRDDAWAHNIVGVFDSSLNSVVCEGFAEAYSLLLNYHGVENVLVPGISGGMGHMWNLIRVDDGRWYWCDITWDDSTTSPLGTDYKYFCVTDEQDVLFYYYRDGTLAGNGSLFASSLRFMDDHEIRWDLHVSLDMSASLPDRATEPYAEHTALRQTFEVDGMTYAITGYGTVQLTNVGSSAEINIPETVTYNGRTYTVASIGRIADNGAFITGSVLAWTTAIVHVPKTVSHIWTNALDSFWAVTITIDPENPWYTVYEDN